MSVSNYPGDWGPKEPSALLLKPCSMNNQHHQHPLAMREWGRGHWNCWLPGLFPELPDQTLPFNTTPPQPRDVYAIKTPKAPPQQICVGHLGEFRYKKTLWLENVVYFCCFNFYSFSYTCWRDEYIKNFFLSSWKKAAHFLTVEFPPSMHYSLFG